VSSADISDSAVRLPLSEASPSAPPPGYLDVGRAAVILGVSGSTVRRMCADGRLEAVRVEGKWGPQWHVNPASSPALRIATGRTGPAPSAPDDPLAGLSEDQRRRIADRLEVVRAWRRADAARPASTPAKRFRRLWCEQWSLAHPDRPVAPRTLERWLARYARGGAAALADGRRANGGRTEASPEAVGAVIGLYLDQARPSLRACYELVQASAEENEWRLPSYSTVRRLVRRRLSPRVEALGRDPRRYRDRMELCLRRDWSRVSAMELWCADHRQHDVWLPRRRADGSWGWARPWLTLFHDARSWYPVAWTVAFDHADANRVMATFARAAAEHGLPEWLYLDNGKDFRASRWSGGRRLKGRAGPRLLDPKPLDPVLDMLGVGVVWAKPYNARAKPVENQFHQALVPFDKTWKTYCGETTETRPERLKGIRPEVAAGRGITIEAFRAALADYLADYVSWDCPVAASRGLSVRRAFAELRAEDFEQIVPSEAMLRQLLIPTKPLMIRQQGLWVHELGEYYWSAEIENRRGATARDASRKVVVKYDPARPEQIWVWDASGTEYLGPAEPLRAVHPLARQAGDETDARRLAEALALQAGGRAADRRDLAARRAQVPPRLAAMQEARRAGADTAPVAPPKRRRFLTLPEFERAEREARERRRRRAVRAAGAAPSTAADLLAAHAPSSREGGGPRAPRGPSALEILARREAARKESDHDASKTA